MNTRISSFVVCIALIFSSVSSLAFDAEVTMSEKAVTFSSNGQAAASISVIIVDEFGNEIFTKSENTKKVLWTLPSDVQNGAFKYQVTLSDALIGSKKSRDQEVNTRVQVSKKSGVLIIQNGILVMPSVETEPSESESANEAETSSLNRLNAFETVAFKVINLLIPAAHADILQLDDVIIDGSSCIGTDCVNGENFGFDTLILKENNLRLLFNDTSVSASFPNNDWRLIANDSLNGGGNFFSIEDATAGKRIFTLDAGAPTNALYVDQNGRIGLGTSTPATSLEMVNGNTPTIRLNQDSSSGWSAQSWDLASNETGFFIRDVTNGSRLPFRILSNAPSNSLLIDATGRVGIGTNQPSQMLHVVGDAIVTGNLEIGSSRSIKNNIKSLGLSQAMTAFKALEPVMFKYNSSPETQSIGFIAEDVPELVATQKRNSLRPMDIVAVLTKVVQEQQKTIDDLSEKLDSLIDNK